MYTIPRSIYTTPTNRNSFLPAPRDESNGRTTRIPGPGRDCGVRRVGRMGGCPGGPRQARGGWKELHWFSRGIIPIMREVPENTP